MAKRKKYYVISTSTNCDEQGLFNQTNFTDGYEIPSFEELTRRACEQCRAIGHEPKPNSTIITCIVRLTKEEYEQLTRKESKEENAE